MEKKTKNATFKYEKNDSFLIEELEKYLDSNSVRIYDFFGIKDNQNKPIINIIATKSKLDDIHRKFNNLKSSDEVPKWLVGLSTSDMQIYCLSLNDYKNTTHAFEACDYDKQLDRYKKTILHEFIHYVNRLFCKKNNCVITAKYLVEGIAQYLSNQKDGLVLQFDYSLNDILNSNNCYDGWYLVTKYIIENYPREFFLELLLDKSKADEFLENSFKEIKNEFK